MLQVAGRRCTAEGGTRGVQLGPGTTLQSREVSGGILIEHHFIYSFGTGSKIWLSFEQNVWNFFSKKPLNKHSKKLKQTLKKV